MIVFEISDVRQFMKIFFTEKSFDAFTLAEASITTFCTWTIDGRLEGTGSEEKNGEAEETAAVSRDKVIPEYASWRIVRPRCLEIIRGKQTPSAFRFVLFYPREKVSSFFSRHGLDGEDSGITGLCMNLRCRGGRLRVTTGVSRSSFSPDRRAEELWDDSVREFFRRLELPAEEPEH